MFAGDDVIPLAVIGALLSSMFFLFRVLPWKKPGSWRWIWLLATVAAVMITIAEGVALARDGEQAIGISFQMPIFVAVLAGAAGFFVVYTDALRASESSRILSLTDSLTGLPNARAFNERMRLAFSTRGREPFTVLYADLDGFKKVNDTQGHEAGDRLLQDIARILQSAVRQQDMVARLGGDEFGFVLRGSDEGPARRVADRALAGLAEIRLAGDLRVGISFGAASSRRGTTPAEILATADAAMYAAKRIGGGRIVGSEEVAVAV